MKLLQYIQKSFEKMLLGTQSGERAVQRSNTKIIVCLANSRKPGGRCVAGKEQLDGSYGEWVRPVSPRITREISAGEQRLNSGAPLQLLDIIEVPLVKHFPHHHQQENHLIDVSRRWVRRGTLNWDELRKMEDNVANDLWINNFSSSKGTNDRIPERIAMTLRSSLLFFQPDTLTVRAQEEYGKRKVRATFTINNKQYKLTVTDTEIEKKFSREDSAVTYDARKVFLCASIGEPFRGYCYKLVASILVAND